MNENIIEKIEISPIQLSHEVAEYTDEHIWRHENFKSSERKYSYRTKREMADYFDRRAIELKQLASQYELASAKVRHTGMVAEQEIDH